MLLNYVSRQSTATLNVLRLLLHSRQEALTNEPLHDCIADVQFPRGFLLSNPFLLMMKDGDVMIWRSS